MLAALQFYLTTLFPAYDTPGRRMEATLDKNMKSLILQPILTDSETNAAVVPFVTALRAGFLDQAHGLGYQLTDRPDKVAMEQRLRAAAIAIAALNLNLGSMQVSNHLRGEVGAGLAWKPLEQYLGEVLPEVFNASLNGDEAQRRLWEAAGLFPGSEYPFNGWDWSAPPASTRLLRFAEAAVQPGLWYEHTRRQHRCSGEAIVSIFRAVLALKTQLIQHNTDSEGETLRPEIKAYLLSQEARLLSWVLTPHRGSVELSTHFQWVEG